jgi:hypothetical protein
LCKQQTSGFTCPIVANMSTNGSSSNYVGGSYEGTWTTTGPWGSGGTTITVGGNSRCSGTSGSYSNTGSPLAGGGGYCWCQMVNEGLSGAWAFMENYGITNCTSSCAYYCAYFVKNGSMFRPAVCRPQVLGSCDGTTVIADLCQIGYAQCIGSKSSSNTAGNYTITCSE